MKKNTQKGFTLVELLVVIAILAILASVAVVGYTAFIDKAHRSNAETEAAQIDSAIEASLFTNEAVLIKEGLWVVKGDEGYDAVTAEPEVDDDKMDDLSENFVDFADYLKEEDGVLVYENHGFKVNVDTGAAEKAE